MMWSALTVKSYNELLAYIRSIKNYKHVEISFDVPYEALESNKVADLIKDISEILKDVFEVGRARIIGNNFVRVELTQVERRAVFSKK